MRPPEFTGGNPRPSRPTPPPTQSFNEAAGIHRRKRRRVRRAALGRGGASMRPPEFTGGNKRHLPVGAREKIALQ